MPFHILTRGLLRLLFICGRVPGSRQQSLIVIAHFGTNHHLELPGVGEAAFNHGKLFNGLRVGFGRIVQHEAQAGNAMADGGDVVASADQDDQLIDICLFDFTHHETS